MSEAAYEGHGEYRLRRAGALAAAFLLGARGAPVSAQSPLQVATVAPHSAGAAAGFQVGDLLLSWAVDDPTAGVQVDGGALVSPFHLRAVEVEQGPRATVRIEATRAGKPVSCLIPPGVWGLETRPHLGGAALALAREGDTLLEKGEPASAAARWRIAALAAASSGDGLAAVWLEARAGRAMAEAGQWDQARLALERAREVAVGLADNEAAAQVMDMLGETGRRHSRWALADAACRESLRLRQAGAAAGLLVAQSADQIGLLDFVRGDLRTATLWACRALGMRRPLAPDSLPLADSLNTLGGAAYQRGDLAGAFRYHREALTIRERLAPGSLDQARSLNNLGLVAWSRGDLTSAGREMRVAVEIIERLAPDSLLLASGLNNLGNLAWLVGDLASASELYSRSLALKERLAPSSLDVAASLNNLGSVMRQRGQLDRAEEYHLRALDIRRRLAPGGLDVGYSLSNLARIAKERGDLDTAEGLFRDALAVVHRVAPGNLDEGASLGELGMVVRARSRPDEARMLFQQCLDIVRRVAPDGLDVAGCVQMLGELDLEQDRLAEAEAHLGEATAILSSLAPGSWKEAAAVHELGRVLELSGRLDEGLVRYRSAVEALLLQQGRLGGGREAEQILRARHADIFRDLLDLEVRLGQPERAFQTLERFRAHSILEMLAERRLDFDRDAPAELLRRRQELDAEFDRTQQELAATSPVMDPERSERLLARLHELRGRQEEVREEIRRVSPRLGDLQYPQPLDLTATRRLLAPGELLLSYSVGPRSTQLFAVTSSRLEVVTLAVERDTLARQVASFRHALSEPAAGRAGISRRSQELYRILLQPAEHLLRSANQLVFCPDGPLHALPFSALEDEAGRFLVERVPVATIISATVLAESRGRGAMPTRRLELLVVGDPVYTPAPGTGDRSETLGAERLPSLPSTRVEVEAIARLFAGRERALLGTDAREEVVKQLAPEARLLHFACHGIVDERFPLSSGLVLSRPPDPTSGQDNGILQAWEVLEQLRLSADLVTLSACDTGLGQEMGGEGLLSLKRAFHYAGAATVVSTLWSVGDETTAALMVRFYASLKLGLSTAEALRRAQCDLIRAPVTLSAVPGSQRRAAPVDASHPFYWAGFALSGEWR